MLTRISLHLLSQTLRFQFSSLGRRPQNCPLLCREARSDAEFSVSVDLGFDAPGAVVPGRQLQDRALF
jgi:hypothetical protein